MNTTANNIRFEKLVSLNIEGAASTKENLELWNILRQHPSLKAEFIQARDMHYLLKVGCDPSASEIAFVNRFRNASQPSGLKEINFLGSLQNRFARALKKKKKIQFAYSTLKIAASLLIILGSAVLCKNLFFRTQPRFPEISESNETYLDWNYKPEIVELKKSIAMFYGTPAPTTYLCADSQNVIKQKKEKINEMINRSETLWP